MSIVLPIFVLPLFGLLSGVKAPPDIAYIVHPVLGELQGKI